MKILKKAGFFRELPHGRKDGPSLLLLSGIETGRIDRILRYLKDGKALYIAPGFVRDFFSEKGKIITSLSILTDGEWAWPSDLSYYVGTYKVQIPNDFKDHMSLNDWVVREVDLLNLSLGTEIF